MTLVLASASPRRRQLLEGVGYQVLVFPAPIVETRLSQEDPVAMAVRLATEKAAAAPVLLPLPVLAADTVVHKAGVVFPKPQCTADAQRILQSLSGAWHEVTTGFCVRDGNQLAQGSVTTRVLFRPLSMTEITRYVASGEPQDKAGAYGIQGLGGALVRALEGSYTNVVGLPLEEVMEMMEQFGVPRPR